MCKYKLANGKVEVIIKGETQTILSAGKTFGELALIYNSPRSATIKTITKCEFFGITRNVFKETLEIINKKSYEKNI